MAESENQAQASHDIRKAMRVQEEEFLRLHRMCDSSRYNTNEEKECFLCLVTTAEVMRAAFEVIASSTDKCHPGVPQNEESSCTYNDPAFHEAVKESLSLHNACTMDKPQSPTRTKSVGESPDLEEPQTRSRFLDILNEALEDAIDSNNRLTVSEACFLTIDAWYRARVAPSEDDFDPIDSRVRVALAKQESDDSAAETVALEDEASPASRSRKHRHERLGEAKISNSSEHSVGGFDETDPSRNEVGSHGTDEESNGTRQPQSHRKKSFFWFCIIAAFLASLFNSPNQEVSVHRPRIQEPGYSDGYITWRMHNVSGLLARAKFGGPDMVYSELVPVRNYKVRLGVGFAVRNSDEYHRERKKLRIWISAVVMKDNEQPWPQEEYMQLRQEHENPDSVRIFDFRSSHKDDVEETWRTIGSEIVSTHTEATEYLKLMRMSYGMTYDNAVSKRYILNDGIEVGFKLMHE